MYLVQNSQKTSAMSLTDGAEET